MSASPKSSRMERSVRNQGRVLFWVSALLLITCASMTGTFGWSLGRTLFDKVLYTMGFVVADIGGAGLMAASGTFAANKARKAAAWAMSVAVLCCALTLLGIAGFQAENRENQVAARKKAMDLSDTTIQWFKSVTTENTKVDKPKTADTKAKAPAANTEAMALGFDAVGRAVREQTDRLLSGDAVASADGQSALISRMTGSTEESARSWTTAFSTLVLLIVQYSCLWFYGFMRQEIEPGVAALAHGPLGPKKTGGFTYNVRKTDIEKARDDVIANVSAGIPLSNGEYADRWDVSPTQVSRWWAVFVREGHMRKAWRGQEKIAVAPLKKLHAVS